MITKMQLRYAKLNLEVEISKIFSKNYYLKAPIEVKEFARKNLNGTSVTELVNCILHKKPNYKQTYSIEDGIFNALKSDFPEIEKGRSINKNNIWGKPDFLWKEIPGEIKSTHKKNNRIVLNKGKLQAALYAKLLEVPYAFLAIGYYEMLSEREARINLIEIYKVEILSNFDLEDIMEYCQQNCLTTNEVIAA